MENKGRKAGEEVIIKTALKLLNKKELTMDNLARDSGISRASIYRRYGGKEKIYKLISDRTNYPIEESGDIKKEILKAARIVFGKKGFYKSTIEDIAIKASVGTATVYRYFETKEKLIQSFKKEYTPGAMIEAMAFEKHSNLEESVYFIVFTGMEFLGNNRDLFRISFFEGDEGLEYYRTSLDQRNRAIPLLTKHFKKLGELGKIKDMDPVFLAYSLLGLIMGHGYIKPAYTGDPSGTLEEDSRQITEIFLKGIKK